MDTWPQQVGQITYVDGHMIAYWSRVPMHKGKITMLGRIMAGSQAVITHDEAGHALFVGYHPPDIHLSQVLVDYCQRVAMAAGISMFVIDRAVNSAPMARVFHHQDLGLLCMFDDNEHHGLENFEATLEETRKDGTKVYSGPRKMPRVEDPRHFVIVEPAEGETLVSWGTPKVKATLEPTAWPQVYQARSEIQEGSFKRMIDHGAFNTNYGRKRSSPRTDISNARRSNSIRRWKWPNSASTSRPRRSRDNRPKWPSPKPKGMANASRSASGPARC